MDYLFILAVGLAAGTISGIVGFGSSIMLMPVLVLVAVRPGEVPATGPAAAGWGRLAREARTHELGPLSTPAIAALAVLLGVLPFLQGALAAQGLGGVGGLRHGIKNRTTVLFCTNSTQRQWPVRDLRVNPEKAPGAGFRP